MHELETKLWLLEKDLHPKRTRESPQSVLTFVCVDFVQGEPRRQRFHVRPELFREGVNELESRRAAADSQALGGHVFSDAVLQVEAHHTVKLQVLQSERWRGVFSCRELFSDFFCQCSRCAINIFHLSCFYVRPCIRFNF